jgi:hypothetical protein
MRRMARIRMMKRIGRMRRAISERYCNTDFDLFLDFGSPTGRSHCNLDKKKLLEEPVAAHREGRKSEIERTERTNYEKFYYSKPALFQYKKGGSHRLQPNLSSTDSAPNFGRKTVRRGIFD